MKEIKGEIKSPPGKKKNRKRIGSYDNPVEQFKMKHCE